MTGKRPIKIIVIKDERLHLLYSLLPKHHNILNIERHIIVVCNNIASSEDDRKVVISCNSYLSYHINIINILSILFVLID